MAKLLRRCALLGLVLAGGMVSVQACSSDDAAAPVGGSVTYAIPANGGTARVTLSSGATVDFVFPPSAGGKTVTLTPSDAAALGWPGDQFSAVIRLEPDGTTFPDPVVVRPSTKEVMAFSFPTRAQKSAPEALKLASSGDGLLLPHFSSIGFVPPKKSCGDRDGWKRIDSAPECASAAPATSKMVLDCGGDAAYCTTLTVTCCVTPTAESGCLLGSRNLSVSQQTPSNAPGYCGVATGTDASASDASDASVSDASDASVSDASVSDASDASDADAAACDPALPAAGNGAAGTATGTLSQSANVPPATFTKAVYFAYPRDLASRWVVQLTDDPDPCTTLETAPVGNCVQTPAAYHYLGARFQVDPVPASTAGGTSYSFNTGVGLYFAQGLSGTFQVDDPMDSASGTVKGRVAICDSKTSSVVHATFSAVRCPNPVNMPCNQ